MESPGQGFPPARQSCALTDLRVRPTKWKEKPGRVAQLVEQRTENPCVAGSIPAPSTVRDHLPLPLCRNLREVGVVREQHPPYRCRPHEQPVVRHPPCGVLLGGKARQDGNGASHQIWARCQLPYFWWLAPFHFSAAERLHSMAVLAEHIGEWVLLAG